MNRLRPKIALVVSACLLGMHLVTGTAVAIAPCPPTTCCSGPMHLDACNDVINFARPIQKCCDDCNDMFCGLLNDPLQDVKPVQPSSELMFSHPSYAVNVQNVEVDCDVIPGPGMWNILNFEVTSNPIPLYIEHLSLII